MTLFALVLPLKAVEVERKCKHLFPLAFAPDILCFKSCKAPSVSSSQQISGKICKIRGGTGFKVGGTGACVPVANMESLGLGVCWHPAHVELPTNPSKPERKP